MNATPPIVCPTPWPFASSIQGAWDEWEKKILLSPDTCARLAYLRTGNWPRDKNVEAQLAESVLTLAHELAHAHGIPETYSDHDAGANCMAAKTYAQVATELGIKTRIIRAMYQFISPYLNDCKLNP